MKIKGMNLILDIALLIMIVVLCVCKVEKLILILLAIYVTLKAMVNRYKIEYVSRQSLGYTVVMSLFTFYVSIENTQLDSMCYTTMVSILVINVIFIIMSFSSSISLILIIGVILIIAKTLISINIAEMAYNKAENIYNNEYSVDSRVEISVSNKYQNKYRFREISSIEKDVESNKIFKSNVYSIAKLVVNNNEYIEGIVESGELQKRNYEELYSIAMKFIGKEKGIESKDIIINILHDEDEVKEIIKTYKGSNE